MKTPRKIALYLLIALLITAFALPAGAEQTAQVSEITELNAQAGENPSPDGAPETQETQQRTMYAKREIKLYKAKKTSAKVLDKVPKGEAVAILDYGKTWCHAQYGEKTGYLRTTYLTDTAPQPEEAPQPTPTPRDRTPSVPASRAQTYYAKNNLPLSISPAEIVAAIVVDYEGLGEGYFSRIYSGVNSNINALLTSSPSVPASLEEYKDIVSAVCRDLAGGATFELMGKQLNSKKTKSSSIFSVDDQVIGASRAALDEAGTWTLDFGEYAIKNVSKGTYYAQMRLVLSSAPSVKALYSQSDSITILYPIKVAKLSTGGGGGGSTAKQQPVARLIVDSIRTEPELPEAGEEFDIILSLRNTSEKLSLKNLQLTYTSEDDALSPLSGTNTEYIELIDADSNYNLRLSVKSKPNMEQSSARLDISVDFEDSKLNSLSASQSLVIPIKLVQRIELDEPKLPTTTTIAGDSYEIQMGVFNMGMTMLYNVTVKAVPEDDEKVAAGQSYYIGNMEPGTSKTAELELIPLEGGYFNAGIEVTYETVDGEESLLTTPISFSVEEEESYDYMDDFEDYTYDAPVEAAPPTALEVMALLPWQIYALAGGLLLLVIILTGSALHRRRLRALEDDEMD